MVRLKDIAEEVGLSIPVVSKVLNSSKGTCAASPQAAALIRETAERMGYIRNRAAAALKTGQQGAIGVLVHPMGSPGSEQTQVMVEAISRKLAEFDQRMELSFYRSIEEFHRQLQRMGANVVDGLIIAGAPMQELRAPLQRLAKESMPVVTVHSRSLCDEIPNVLCDEGETLYLATRHLIELGCRKIAQVAYWPQRSVGYERAIKESDLEFDERRVYWTRHTEFVPQIGEDAVATLQYRGVEFDGLVCQADIYALGAIQALLQNGRRIPDDVKIIGVDNSPYCQFTPVPLSSISLELYKRSQLAVEMIMEFQQGRPVESRAVPPRLYSRGSTIGRSNSPTADAASTGL